MIQVSSVAIMLLGFLGLAACRPDSSQPAAEMQPGTERVPVEDSVARESGEPDRAASASSGVDVREKLALVIAIGNYPDPETNGYRPINSLNDIGLITGALEAQGFADSDVRVLRDADADRAGVWEALDQLLERAGEGDIVVVHYSGHGDQLTDDNGDEVDGYDEVLVPYGAPSAEYFRRTDGANAAEAAIAYAADPERFAHIRDDELNDYFLRLRSRVGSGGNVIVWIDSCHSGTGTRGLSGPMPRGTTEPIGPRAPAATAGLPDQAGMFESQATGSGTAPFVVFSASRQGELSWETRDEDRRPVGPLSLALSRALGQIRAGDSYQALFDRVSLLMSSLAPNQLPQIEGDTQTEVFSGRAVVHEPYYTIDDVLAPNRVVLNAGRLTGVTAGSRVAVYPIGDGPSDLASPLATGTVGEVGPMASEVLLDVGIDDDAIGGAWTYVTDRAYGDLGLAVHLSSDLDPETRNGLVQALTSSATLNLVGSAGEADLVVRPATRDARDLSLVTGVGGVDVGEPISSTSDWVGEIRSRLLDYSRNQYLKLVVLEAADVAVELDVVPAIHTFEMSENGLQCTSSEVRRSDQTDRARSVWRFTEGDGFLLRLRNTGSIAAHVAVLELYPDGNIGQLIPNSLSTQVRTADDARLDPGQELLVANPCFSAAPPYGNYVFKLFATESPIDFAPIITLRAGTRRVGENEGAMGPIERLLGDAHAGSRAAMAPVDRGAGSTDSVVMSVVAR